MSRDRAGRSKHRVNEHGILDTIATYEPDVWVLLTQSGGDNDQSLALAEALDSPCAVKRIDWRAAGSAQERAIISDLLAATPAAEHRRRAAGLHAPWPRIVICCGQRSERVGFWIKRQSGGRTKIVSVGRAHQPLDLYDLLAVPPQYALPERSNVINLPLPLSRPRRRPDDRSADPATRSNIIPVPKPWFTILLGGEVKQFAADERELVEVARRAQAAADRYGGSVVISTSRRTPPALLAAVERVLDRPYVYRWSEATAEENPYDTLLRQSAALFVTADSASMILDGCGSGTPTYVIEYPQRLDLARRCRRDMFRLIRWTVERCRGIGLRRAGDLLDRAQEWLHARGILRFPRDMRRLHASIYTMGLAQPVGVFDPARLPARSRIANDLTELSGVRHLAARCLAL